MGKREKTQRLVQEIAKKEEISGIHKDLGASDVKFQQDHQFVSEEVDETEGVHDSRMAGLGRKASRKHKTK